MVENGKSEWNSGVCDGYRQGGQYFQALLGKAFRIPGSGRNDRRDEGDEHGGEAEGASEDRLAGRDSDADYRNKRLRPVRKDQYFEQAVRMLVVVGISRRCWIIRLRN